MHDTIRVRNSREMFLECPWRSQIFPISTPLLHLSLTSSSTTQGVSLPLLSSLATLTLDSFLVSKGDCICSYFAVKGQLWGEGPVLISWFFPAMSGNMQQQLSPASWSYQAQADYY